MRANLGLAGLALLIGFGLIGLDWPLELTGPVGFGLSEWARAEEIRLAKKLQLKKICFVI